MKKIDRLYLEADNACAYCGLRDTSYLVNVDDGKIITAKP